MMLTIPEPAFAEILPELIITVSAVIALLLGAFGRQSISGPIAGAVALTGTGLAMVFTASLWGVEKDIYNSFYTIDNFGTFFKGMVLVVSLLVTLLSLRYAERERMVQGEYYSLLLF